ncbi:DUF1007 family protein [Desulfurispira natronophila]|uniref:ABC-type uncharacterized transport system substrate-binding protein n=1 Tax=Desulfurispira natronophila TaxID=682562 RepID=A0A7W7Y496_9BACT|nr:DUF1007 family protein [Desulfurispira natronophila]MBB5021805.1 ABC-type uncharacterized transport system substrate-binding protein [Desulfurispira natronophila]
MILRRSLLMVIALTTWILTTSSAQAHPHVFMDTHLKVDMNASGVQGLGVTWVFDEMTSQLYIMEFGLNRDGLTQADVDRLARDLLGNLHRHSYFLTVKVNEVQVPITQRARDFAPQIHDNRLWFAFYVPLDLPLSDGDTFGAEVYEEEGFIAITIQDEYIAFSNETTLPYSLDKQMRDYTHAWSLRFSHDTSRF